MNRHPSTYGSRWSVTTFAVSLLILSGSFTRNLEAQTCPTKPPGRTGVFWIGRATGCDVHGKPCFMGEIIDFQAVALDNPGGYTIQPCDVVTLDFGDGTQAVSSGAATPHQYANAGRYELNVTVTNALGSWNMLRDAGSAYITVSATLPCPIGPPSQSNYVVASCSKCVLGQSVTFSVVTPPAGEPEPCDRFAWDFGDGTTSSERSPVHAFTRAGAFPVLVKEWNGIGDPIRIGTPVTVVAPTKRRSAHH